MSGESEIIGFDHRRGVLLKAAKEETTKLSNLSRDGWRLSSLVVTCGDEHERYNGEVATVKKLTNGNVQRNSLLDQSIRLKY